MKDATLKQAGKLLELVAQKEIPSEQLQKILGSGLFSDLLDANADQIDRGRFREVLGLRVKILEHIGTVTIPASTEKFVAKDHFLVDTSRKARVRISFLGDNFKKWFLGKVDEPISETTLCYHRLLKSSVDNPIITELGREEKVETTLTEMFRLMEKQPNGENGILLTNGYANIFYVRDFAGVLRAVFCSWYDGGWRVLARSVEYPASWVDGFQVFSRNSSPSES